MKRLVHYALLVALFLISIGSQAHASHAMGADLTYNCVGPNTYRVRLSFFRDCSGITPSSSFFCTVNSASCAQNLSVTLNQLVGFPIEVSPICPAQLPLTTCSGGTLPGVQQYVYEGTIVLPLACTDWIFFIEEGNRNAAITTLTAPSSAWLRVEARMNSVVAPCNNSPDFTTLPVPYICLNQPYVYNHGAIDPDGDSLSYSLVNALDLGGGSVTYAGGFSGANPMTSVPAVTINSTNGNMTMTPTAIQVAVVAVRVNEYRNGVLIGSVVRDIQVTVLNCSNVSPNINAITGVVNATQVGPYSIQVCPGQTLSFTIPGSDPDVGQLINWSWNNGIPGGVFVGPSGSSPQNATFTWTPTGADVGLNSLTLTLRDNACPVLGTQTRAIDITVLQGTTAGPDQAYCVGGGPVQLNAVGGTVFTWNVLSGSAGSLSCTNCANPTASPALTTTYQVVSNLPGPCKNRDTIVVTNVPSFTLAMGPAQTICTGGSTTLSATPNPAGAYTYLWSPSTALSSTALSNPTASPTSNTLYTALVTSAAGCRISGTQNVTVSPAILAVAPTVSPAQSCAGAPVTLTANATTGDCNQYVISTPAFGAVGGGGWTNLTLADDELSAAIPIGFNFSYFCNTFTNAYISSNAYVSFDPLAGAGCCSGQNIPNVSTPNNTIFVHHEDYASNTVRYKTIGSAPNRIFIVHYNGAAHLSGGGSPLDAQVMLFETSNNVEIHITDAGTDGTGETEGIENSTGTIAFPIPGRNATPWSAVNDARRFAPVAPVPFTVNWQTPLGTTVATGLTANVTPATQTTYYAVASNGICSATAPILVDVANVNAGPDINICPAGNNASLNAVYSGPPAPSNCAVYTVAATTYAPVAVAGTTLTLGDDQISAAVPIGFNFTFFCQVKTQIYFGSNGFITFNAASASGCCSGSPLPTATLSDFIAGTWNDLYPPAGGTIQYQTQGIAPNRVFIADYNGINHCCSAGPINTFQIKLFETTNVIEIHNTTITDDTSPHTQGIQSSAGVAVAVPGRSGTNFTATNDAFSFIPQVGTISYSWSPATFLSSTTISNPNAIGVGSPTTYTVTVNNGTCIMTDVINITVCLPVDNLQLEAEKQTDRVKLRWDAVNEQSLSHYVIERSGNASTWSDLGTVQAIGQPNATQTYQSDDNAPLGGVNYYRLRVIDLNGAVNYSNQVEVFFAGDEWVNVSPNPGRNVFVFEVAKVKDGDLVIDIFNTEGKAVQTLTEKDSPAGVHRLKTDLGAFSAGVYLYRVRTGTQELNGRLLKID